MADQSQVDLSHMVVDMKLGPFEVKSPPVKKHMVGGHLVPTMRSMGRFLMSKKRLMTVEIHSRSTDDDGLEEKAPKKWDPDTLKDHDRVLIRTFRLAKKGDDSDSDEDDISAATSPGSIEDELEIGGKSWKEHKTYRVDDVEILDVSGKIVEMKLGAGNDTVIRDFRFETSRASAEFEEAIMTIQTLEQKRAKKKIAAYKEKILNDGMTEASRDTSKIIEEDSDGMINVLVEIVSATDLPIADVTSTDPYVIARMKGNQIHRTDVINNNLNPIWTLETGSLFLISMTPDDFFAASSGLTLVLKDYDHLNHDDMLGSVTIPLDEILDGKGDRKGYDILPDKSSPKNQEGKTARLYLRFKKAESDDLDFMEAVGDSAKKHGVFAKESFLTVQKRDSTFMKRQEKTNSNGEKIYRVKPEPDPSRPEEETEWMTKKQIHEEALKPSTRWVQAGSGDLGTLYVEVIGCDGLPNMDSATMKIGDKTDAFACMVYEDAIVNTDAIGNSLSPRWMPWCHRAFAFKMANPSSSLLIGVFDYDPEMAPGQLLATSVNSVLHDPIGRIVVNVNNFRPGTTYMLDYSLYYGETEEYRKEAKGTISLRVRLEVPSVQKLMVKGLQPPVPTIVSVPKKNDFDVAHYTADGVVDDNKFSVGTITGYVGELTSYLVITESITQAITTVLLWRGHYPLQIGDKKYQVPLHSITAFIWGILVTWNFDRAVSFFFFSIGWILLACNESVGAHPSRWHKRPSYYELLLRLAVGKVLTENVKPFENKAESEAYEKRMKEMEERRIKEQEKEAEQEAALQEELGQDLENAEEAEQLDGKKSSLSKVVKNPLKPVLYPIQKLLRQVIYTLRAAKSVVLWSEAYYSFWLVTACFAACIATFWFPWAFVLRWTSRIVVFVVLGPWMILVDKYYFKTNPNMSQEEKDEQLKQRLKSRYDDVLLTATNFFVRRERALKYKSMQKFMYGRHMLRVPQFREDLYEDIPLISSSCKPTDKTASREIKISECKYGQKLAGDMIPKREVQIKDIVKGRGIGRGSTPHSLSFWKKKKAAAATTAEKVPLLGNLRKGYDSVVKDDGKKSD